MRHHHLMAAINFPVAPAVIFPAGSSEFLKRTWRKARGPDIGPFFRPRISQLNRLLEGGQRVIHFAPVKLSNVFRIGKFLELCRWRRDALAIAFFLGNFVIIDEAIRWLKIHHRLTIFRQKGIQINQRISSGKLVIRSTSDHHATITVPNQYDIGQFFTVNNA